MKKLLIFTIASVVIGALIWKRKKRPDLKYVPATRNLGNTANHHVTNVFSRAKSRGL